MHYFLCAAILFLLLTQSTAQEFRGGFISWSVPAYSNTVNFTFVAYWTPYSEATALMVNWGDGTSESVALGSPVPSAPGFSLTTGIHYHTFPSGGEWTINFVGCCRLVTKNVPANKNFIVTTRVNLDGTYQVSPTLVTGVPLVSIGVGTNNLPLASSFPGMIAFSPFFLSEIDLKAASFAVSAPTIIPDPISGSLSTLNWVTGAADVGLWTVQVMANANLPQDFLVVSDFIIKVVAGSAVNSYSLSLTYSPNLPVFNLNAGEDLRFTITCSGPPYGSTVGLFISDYQTGITLNGVAAAAVNYSSGTPITVVWRNPPTVNGLTTPYVLPFTCIDYTTFLVTYPVAIQVSVGIPLTLIAPPSVTIQCFSFCSCIVTGQPTYTSGCCFPPTITFRDYGVPGNCNNVIIREWSASNQCGQTAKANQTIIVNDITPPVLGPLPPIGDLECYALLSLPQYQSTVTASDNCGGKVPVLVTQTVSNGQSDCNNIITRTYKATDSCGNSVNVSQAIRVNNPVPATWVPTYGPTTVECLKDIGAFNNLVNAYSGCNPTVALPLTISDTAYPLPICGSWNRTWIAQNGCNVSSQYSKVLTVRHTTPPTIILPPQQTSQCGMYSSYSYSGYAMPTASSVCGMPLTISVVSDVLDSLVCHKSRTITWLAGPDECGLTTTATQVININNNVLPTLNIPPNILLQCSPIPSAYPSIIPNTTGYAPGIDACGRPITITFHDSAPTTGCNITTFRTWKGVDVCGLVQTGVQTISVIDTTAPVFTVKDFYGECVSELRNIPFPNWTDCQSSVKISYTDVNVTSPTQPPRCGNVNITRTWRLDDNCGNVATQVQKIVIFDTVPPHICVPVTASVECTEKTYPAITGYPCVSDNCELTNVPTFTDVKINATLIIRVWTIVDNCGNVASANQSIYLVSSGPALTIPRNVTVPCEMALSPDVLGYATAFDNCIGNLTPSYKDVVISTCPTVIYRNWSVYDFVTGTTVWGIQVITVDHPGAGNITGLRDISGYQCINETFMQIIPCGIGRICADDIISTPVYSDTISPAPTCAYAAGGYTVTRTWTIFDQCKRSTSAIQKLFVRDTTPPTFSFVPKDQLIICPTEILGTCAIPTATDNCDNNVTVTYRDVPNSPTCPTQISRIFSATDCAGNTASVTQTFSVFRRPPIFNGAPCNVSITCPDISPYFLANVTATDSCGNVIHAVPTYTKFGQCPTTFVITWTATDSCGVSATIQQTIIANDQIPPTLILSPNAATTGTCPNKLPTYGQVTASDNCPLSNQPTFTQVSANAHANCTCVECLQQVIRDWIVYDDCGNPSSIVVQTILTQKNVPPTLNLPPDVNNCALCNSNYGPVISGAATAVDQCGNILPTLYSDTTTVTTQGTTLITRTWSATDTCNQTTTGTQTICLAAPQLASYYADDESFYPPNVGSDYCIWHTRGYRLHCGQDADDLPAPRCNSVCGEISFNYSFENVCGSTSGALVRNTDVYVTDKNGRTYQIGSGSETFTMEMCACDKVRDGIENVPTTPIALGKAITPTILVYAYSLPCDVVTFYFIWGDGRTTNTISCDPNSTQGTCIFDFAAKTVSTSFSHMYTVCGTYTLQVVAANRGYAPPSTIPQGVTYGKGWVVFWQDVVIFDPTKGQINGNVKVTNWSSLTVAGTAGKIQASFSTSFTLGNGTALTPQGNTKLTWGSGTTLFCSVGAPTFLEIYAPTPTGYSALWKGKGIWSMLPNTSVDYEVFVMDSHVNPGTPTGDIFHMIVTDPKDAVTVFDSNPASTLTSPTQTPVDSGTVTVDDPPPVNTFATLQHDYDRQRGALIGVGIFAGIIAMFLFASIGVIIYLAREAKIISFKNRTITIPKLGK